jgi:SET domain-containing protein
METKKKYLLHNLQNETYVRLKPSKIDKKGVGVFAIKNIPKGKNPFNYANKKHNKCSVNSNTINISKQELKHTNKNVIKLIKDFFHPNSKGYFPIPVHGINSLDISYYLNHSNKPNLEIYDCDGCNHFCFKTIKNIKQGTELTFNYNQY